MQRLTQLYKSRPVPERNRRRSGCRRSRPLCRVQRPRSTLTRRAPGSPSAKHYLERAGLLADLQALGFSIVGYGCTTCIGNSGPLTPEIAKAIEEGTAAPVAVLSGNRSFPGRIHPDLNLGFLASPALVIAFALAGTADIDIVSEPLARAADGSKIMLADLWPSGAEIDTVVASACDPAELGEAYTAAERSEAWMGLDAPTSPLWQWDGNSTYIRRPPFAASTRTSRVGTYEATPLLVLGDDMTTDHISPAGQIPPTSEAARHLVSRGEKSGDLNVFAARRGNWEVMVRGLFTNKSTINHLAHSLAPGLTVHSRARSEVRQRGKPADALSDWSTLDRPCGV